MRRVSFVTNKVFWRLELTIGTSCEFESRVNCLARLEVLSYSATASVTLQLPCMLHTCATFGDLPVARSSREALLECTLELFFTLSHTLPLQDSHLNTKFLNAELQENFARNKANKMVN